MRSLVATSLGVVVDLVDTDVVVGPARVEESARLGPGEGEASKLLGRLLVVGALGGALELIGLLGEGGDLLLDELLLGEVEDLDASVGGNDEPVELLGEEDAVDGRLAVLSGEPLAVDNVPNHDHTVTRAGGEEGRVLDDIEGGDLGLVTAEGVEEVHAEVIPDLDGLIPRGSDAESGLLLVVEADNRDGIGVLALLDGELALRAGVPDLDGLVEGASDDLTVIGGEGNREHILLVADQLGDGSAGGNVPQTAGAIPRGRDAETGVAGELHLRDEVRVTSHELAGLAPLAVLLFLTGLVEVPLDEGLITGSGKKELSGLSINLLLTDSERSNPAAVAYSNATKINKYPSISKLCHTESLSASRSFHYQLQQELIL